MSKPILNKTKEDFVAWLGQQDDDLWYDMVTTGFDDNTELAKFRKQFLKLLNDRNIRKLKS